MSVDVKPSDPATAPALVAAAVGGGAPIDNAPPLTLATREDVRRDLVPSAPSAEANSRAASLASGSAGEVKHVGPTQDPAAILAVGAEQ